MTDNEGTYYEYNAPTQCYAGEHTTDFAGSKNMDQMKGMLANADHAEVESCAKGWMQVHDQLVVGSGSAKSVFDAAVEHITQHWDGAAAEGFKAQAKVITKMISDCSTYARYTSQAMTNAASVLKTIKPQVDAMEKPGTMSSFGDALGDGFDRSDAQLHSDLGNGMGTQSALDKNRGSLSAGKEAQLEMAVKMEQLGAGYNAQSMTMGSWTKKPMPKRYDERDDYPGDPGGVAPVPMPIPSEVGSPRPGDPSRGRTGGTTGTLTPSREVKSPRESGITGGVQKPVASTKPQVGTAIDGIAGGATGAGGYAGGTAGVGGGVGGAGGAGAGGSAGAGAGVPGALGGLGGRGGTAGGAGAAGAGRGGSAGRGGMPGAGGAGAGAGGRGGAAAGRGGSLARRGGGVVGAAKGSGSGTRGTPGGSGLHRSRGAAGAGSGGNAGRGANRMMGRGQTDRTEEEERREGERPDYLVEDEETWTPERNNAPRVIE
ncbi:hypothetical protein OIE69_13170 [Actinacidiphila glaucinigra]|uniref:hypothetical protein n=1 Tax=Actinacidiphila glaucinigra TaxID=235986 RepID=UPI002DD8A6EE|nr:hypothetical protein [Actinacidiphila glaucinigra]WSD59811.1 hypothetical protein OIE69_13170 [Actinacidiphila glaucinigra]